MLAPLLVFSNGKAGSNAMNGHNRTPDPHQILLSCDPVPRTSVILLSVFAHAAAVALIVAFWHRTGVYVVPEKHEMVQVISGPAHLPFFRNSTSSKSRRAQATPFRGHRSTRRARVPASTTAAEGASGQALRERARRATAGMMASIRARGFYGFSSDGYQLPVQREGTIPLISAAELPPRFEQLVLVDVTIDTDGRVADAQIVGGMVEPAIERKLLAAIREFKYSPAKHNGAPIPSQVELVIHIPS